MNHTVTILSSMMVNRMMPKSLMGEIMDDLPIKAVLYGVPFVSKFITSGHLENTGGIYKSSGHLHKL